MGPILPQLSVYGKELGISAMVMGIVTAILPLSFIFFKFAFGVLVDAFQVYRKVIFIAIILAMSLSFSALCLVPAVYLSNFEIKNVTCGSLKQCNLSISVEDSNLSMRNIICSCDNSTKNSISTLKGLISLSQNSDVCFFRNSSSFCEFDCDLECREDLDVETSKTTPNDEFDSTFWYFVLLMSAGTILFNVVNSISDAVCFDMVGDSHDYGQQRVWGTIGWGFAAMVSGFAVDWWSPGPAKSYTPALIVMTIFIILDVIACTKLKLPNIDPPTNIVKDLRELLSSTSTTAFLVFVTIAGVLDGVLIYFLLWYVEDLALEAQTANVKVVEGFVVAAETLGTEILFFAIAGKILDKIGYQTCMSLCFINYGVRFGLIALVQSPWWIVPVEYVMQGPTYGLMYSTIVSYANKISPPGMSATTQGIVAGLDDGVGYSIGSLLGGFLYKTFGGRCSFSLFAIGSFLCALVHFCLYRTCLKDSERRLEYVPPSSGVVAGTTTENKEADDLIN
ncbi:uncharacterized protein LOC108738985 isoform X2 [Agrilus planipennis]|nr:uncharacterized protein LOC108738985 isoform X2 [Agrilus planipennis]